MTDEINAVRFTPIHLAVKDDDFEEFKLLLDSGADVNQKTSDKYGESALHLACESKVSLDIFDLLLNTSNIDINSQCKFDKTPLFTLILRDITSHKFTKQLTKFEQLLDKEPNVKLNPSYGSTLLHHLLENIGSLSTKELQEQFNRIVAKVIHLGCNVNERSKFSTFSEPMFPLQLAIMKNHYYCIELLLDLKANFNVETIVKGYTIPQLFIIHNKSCKLAYQVKMIELFLEYVDINISSYSGVTILHECVRQIRTDLIRVLLQTFKADVHAKDLAGRTPIQYVFMSTNIDYEDKLCLYNVSETIGILLRHGADISSVDNCGISLLMIAARRCLPVDIL